MSRGDVTPIGRQVTTTAQRLANEIHTRMRSQDITLLRLPATSSLSEIRVDGPTFNCTVRQTGAHVTPTHSVAIAAEFINQGRDALAQIALVERAAPLANELARRMTEDGIPSIDAPATSMLSAVSVQRGHLKFTWRSNGQSFAFKGNAPAAKAFLRDYRFLVASISRQERSLQRTVARGQEMC